MFYHILTLLTDLPSEVVEEETKLFSANQVGGYVSTAVLAIINLLIAYLVLRFFVFNKILGILKDRENLIKNQIDEAEKSNEEAKARVEESKQIIDAARAEAAQIVNEAKESAESQANVIISKANESAQQTLLKTDDEVKKIKKTALEEVKDEVTDLAVEVSEKVIGEIVSKNSLEELCEKHARIILDAEVDKIDAN